VIHNLLTEEKQGYKRLHQRPRCLILVPTRELATQVLDEVKRLSHFAKVSSCGILGGEAYNIQKKILAGKVDMVVASPGRLVQHEKLKNLELQEVSHVVIDEVDTMLTQGFGSDIRWEFY
jgi:superfamily II DNA/RNA helicase